MSILVRVDGPCGTILIRNESRRNALSRTMLKDLIQALDDLHQEAGVRAVCLTGHGDVFTSGIDLYELQASRDEHLPERLWFEDAELQRQLLMKLLQFPKPVLAAVNGPALGFGVGLVAACDVIMAAENARFGFPELLRGLTPGVSVPLLAYRLGAAWANQLLMRTQPIDADEAYRIGLVQERVKFDLLWARAVQWAGEIAQTSPVSLMITKRLLNETVGEQLATQLSAAAAMLATARTTEQAIEGVSAFLEKRKPDWSKRRDLDTI